MAETEAEMVTVIIPAYNAADTLDETLRSVRGQTHAALEILVVDDGSRDATPEIAARHAKADPRVRLIRQQNGGVARARNRGIAEARTALIAPVDADDLWAPTKIAAQLAAMRRMGPETVLAYTWYAQIDENSRVTALGPQSDCEGWVLNRMLLGNLIGNGSAALMRREAVLAVGGFDARLRDMKAQGCEDLLLYFRLSEIGPFALVPEPMTGYRQTMGAMSSDAGQMIRSWELVAQEMRERHPTAAASLRDGRRMYLFWLLERAVRAGSWSNARLVAAALLRAEPLHAPLAFLARQLRHRLRAARALVGRWRRRLADPRRAVRTLASPSFPVAGKDMR